jgi:hypothetical protein
MTKKEKYILFKAVKFGKDKLGITAPFTLKWSDNREGFKTTGAYDSKNHVLSAYTKGRAICDICRSVLHELVHHLDNVSGKIKGNEPDVGEFNHKNINADDIENRANAIAGSLVKEFSYKLKNDEGIDIYNIDNEK